jgi:hypothetical protein
MSSLLNKLKGHSSDKHHISNDPNESYNQPSSNTGYDNANTSGYGNTTSPTHHGETGFGNTQNTSGGYNDGSLNSHSDGGKYYPPKGTAVGQGYNAETAGPHNSEYTDLFILIEWILTNPGCTTTLSKDMETPGTVSLATIAISLATEILPKDLTRRISPTRQTRVSTLTIHEQIMAMVLPLPQQPIPRLQ